MGVAICALVMLPGYSPAKQIPASKQQVQLSYAALVKKAAPAVVNIFSKKTVKAMGASPFSNDPFFKKFFGDNSPFSFGLPRARVVSSLGSGVIVRSDGLIISNNHVIGKNREIKVVLSDKREFEAEVVLSDKASDLAVIKIKNLAANEVLPYLEFADSDDIEVGDLVLAIGNPFGVGQTVTSGIVSALARTNVEVSDYQYFIQTDAAINPGNSGGALVDMSGKVVGINTAIFSKTGGSLGIGFATPSNMVTAVISAAAGSGRIVRPWLGATSQNVTQTIADSLGLKRPIGVLVKNVFKQSAAEKAGLKKGDVIISIDNKEVEDQESLRFRIATYEIGRKVNFGIIRNGREKTISIEMQPPIEIPPRNETKLEGEHMLSGLMVANLSPALAHELKTNHYEGVIVMGVWNRSPAKRLGIGSGDIIKEINDVQIKTVKQLVKMADKLEGNNLKLTIQRGSQIMVVTVRQ
jgi:serine protease Do